MKSFHLILFIIITCKSAILCELKPPEDIKISYIGCETDMLHISWRLPDNFSKENQSILIFAKQGSKIITGKPSANTFSYLSANSFGKGSIYENDSNALCIYNDFGEEFTVTGLKEFSTYYFTFFCVINNSEIYSPPAEYFIITLKPEPEIFIKSFFTAVKTSTSITLVWTEEVGDIKPDGYLIKSSVVGFEFISIPVDGIPENDDIYTVNVSASSNSCTFEGLMPKTMYYFKIFPYTNSGESINYKIQGRRGSYINEFIYQTQ